MCAHVRCAEMLNRVDELVIFEPLSVQAVNKIVQLEIADLNGRLVDRNIDVELTDAAMKHIAATSYSTTYGARPMKRWIDRNITTELSQMLLGGKLPDHSSVVVDCVIDEEVCIYICVYVPVLLCFKKSQE